MARILAIDWDGVEARFVLGAVLKDRLLILNVGAAPIEDADEKIAKAASEIPELDDDDVEPLDEDDESVVETVEKAYVPRMPVADDEDEDEEVDAAVVTVKKKSGESYRTSNLATALKNLLREKRVGKATVCYAAERGDVDVMPMTIPNANDAETPELIFNQVLRDSLTFNESQPLDYCVLGLPETARRTGFRRVAAVSIARDKLRRVRETLIGAHRAPKKIELREPSLAEFIKADFIRFDYPEPVLLVQELCDEVNLTLCYQRRVLFFRSFKLQPCDEPFARAKRIREEIARTLVVGIDDLPEDAVVSRVAFFTDCPNRGFDVDDAEDEETEDDDSAANLTPRILANLLREDEVELVCVNPFQLPGVQLKTTEPLNSGRFASLIGMILAERKQYRPAIDLLHPHEKPKPPNFTLLFVFYFILVGAAAFGFWRYNKNELERLNAEIENLNKTGQTAVAEANAAWPLWNTLSSANNWQNVQGVVVLDEFRDLATRLPSAPDFVVTRLAYVANYRDARFRLNGIPAFLISAKITDLSVFQQFKRNVELYGAHVVYTKGPRANEGGGGYKYLFEAVIACRRRAASAFLAVQPNEIREISNNAPEYYVQREEERRQRLLEQKEKTTQALDESIALARKVVEGGPDALDNAAENEAEKPSENAAEAAVATEKESGEAEKTQKADAEPSETEALIAKEEAFGKALVQRRDEINGLAKRLASLNDQNVFTGEEYADITKKTNDALALITNAYNAASRRVAAVRSVAAQEEYVKSVDAAIQRVDDALARGYDDVEALVKEWPSSGTNASQTPTPNNGENAAENPGAPPVEGENVAENAENPPSEESETDDVKKRKELARVNLYAQLLQQRVRPYLANVYNATVDRAKKGGLSSERAQALVDKINERAPRIDAAVNESRKKWNELSAALDPYANNTAEQDEELRKNLVNSRNQSEARFRQAQQALAQGSIPQNQFEKIRQDYIRYTNELTSSWQALEFRTAARAQANEAAAPETPAPEAPASAPDAPAPAPETPAPAPEAPASAPEAPASAPEAPAPAPEAPAPAPEAPAPAPEAPAPAPEAPAPAPEAPAPAPEAPAPAPEAPAPAPEAPAPAPEAPAPAPEAPAPAPEAPAPAPEAPAPAPEAPAPETTPTASDATTLVRSLLV